VAARTKPSAPKSTTNVVAQARKGAPKRSGSSLWENVKSILGAVAIYLVIRTFLVEAFRIPSGSMIPSLLVGDWLFVNKLIYGPTIPFTDVRLPGYREPRRGDVAVFESPPQPDEAAIGNDPTPTLVKRLVGMPGDTLYMRRGLLHVNGLPQRQGFAAASNPVGDPDEYSPLFEWQHRIEARGSRFGDPPPRPTHDNWGPLVIPSGFYFMMGDNRYCSKDSRYWSIVPRQNLKGRPLIVYYSYVPGGPPDPSGCSGESSDRPLSFITDIRWGRIGHVIR
jgi:signal peptidase I